MNERKIIKTEKAKERKIDRDTIANPLVRYCYDSSMLSRRRAFAWWFYDIFLSSYLSTSRRELRHFGYK